MNINIPSQEDYTNNIPLYQELFKSIIPNACTKVGATIYEWLIRPFSILSASTQEAIDELGTSYTLSALQNSTATDNAIADAVMSNYFITRGEGSKSQGVIRLYSTNSFTKVPDTTIFISNGVSMHPIKTTIGVYENLDTYASTTATAYVQAIRIDNTYCFNIPVEAYDNADSVVAEGAEVDVNGLVVGMIKAEMGSALSGGGSAETDAEMVTRAKAAVASQVGGNQTILKLLSNSGYYIYGAFTAGPGDIEMTRDQMNSFHLAGGGCVDTYVKTSDYTQSGVTQITLSKASDKFVADITESIPAGALGVSITPVDSTHNITYRIIFGSSDNTLLPEDARLSSKQTVGVEVTAPTVSGNTLDVIVSYTYVPYIKELQEYVDRDDVKIAGLNILIKSAVPVEMTLSADCVLQEYTRDDIAEQIKLFINTQEIGSGVFNVSDLQANLTQNRYGVSLRSPILLQGAAILKDGVSKYFYRSSNGVLNATSTAAGFSKRTTFFCISDADILINPVN